MEFPEQMVVMCKEETLRNELLKLINERILSTRDYIKKMEMPVGVAKHYCTCFEPEYFEEVEEVEEEVEDRQEEENVE